jgi:hypothetical protein
MTDSNVTPFRPKDRTATERKRRSRAKQRKRYVTPVTVTPVTAPVTLPTMAGHGHDAQYIGGARELGRSSVAIRDAARSAASVAAPDSRYVARLLTLEEPPTRRRIESQPPAVERRAHRGADALAYAVAIGLASVAAYFSIRGMTVLFPGAPTAIVIMGGMMEAAKLVACAWLARSWWQVPYAFRGILILLIAGLAVINAAGTFSQLTAAHVGDRALTAATRGLQATELDGRIDVATAKVADIDRRIAAIDSIVAGAAQRGRANTAQAAMADQSKARATLVGERQRAAEALAALKVDRGGVAARAAIAESEAAPIMYAAEVLGIGSDPERAIRWLIALLVLCLDPMAIALTAAASARRNEALTK